MESVAPQSQKCFLRPRKIFLIQWQNIFFHAAIFFWYKNFLLVRKKYLLQEKNNTRVPFAKERFSVSVYWEGIPWASFVSTTLIGRWQDHRQPNGVIRSVVRYSRFITADVSYHPSLIRLSLWQLTCERHPKKLDENVEQCAPREMDNSTFKTRLSIAN